MDDRGRQDGVRRASRGQRRAGRRIADQETHKLNFSAAKAGRERSRDKGIGARLAKEVVHSRKRRGVSLLAKGQRKLDYHLGSGIIGDRFECPQGRRGVRPAQEPLV